MERQEVSLRALEVVLEEAIALWERDRPGFSGKLFKRVTRRARRESVPDIRRGLPNPADVKADREAVTWLVRVAVPRDRRK
jgi:hypothetical protein